MGLNPVSMGHHEGVRPRLFLLRCVCAAFLLSSLDSVARAEALLVSAAASLTDVLNELTAPYKRAIPGAEITYNFGGSGTLQRQIENGAPVDVFITAAAIPMDVLEKQNLLLSGSRADLLTNTLVLITSKERRDLNNFADLATERVKHIAIGEPKTVPAGLYAVEFLNKEKLMTQVEGKLVRLLDVRQVLATVATRNADAGFVYRTDATISPDVRIVATVPPESHQKITYPIAIMRRTSQPEVARKYVDFLMSEPARAIFEKHGFSVAGRVPGAK